MQRGGLWNLVGVTWLVACQAPVPASLPDDTGLQSTDPLSQAPDVMGDTGDAGPTAALSLSWRSMSEPGDLLTPRLSALSYWVGSEWLIWGGETDVHALGDGALYNPRTDTWRPVTAAGAPSQRSGLLNQREGFLGGSDGHMLVWGGHDAEGYFLDPTAGGDGLRDGAIYHVQTQTWTPMAPAPSAC